jgi:hypothetical protein
MVIALVAIPAVSAKSNDYVVSPAPSDGKLTMSKLSAAATYTITQGQTRTHTSNIPGGVAWLEYNLNWGNTANSLQLKLYSPSGTYLGAFYDNSDGKIDGRIHLSVYQQGSQIEQGVWRAPVYGYSVTGTQSYTLNVYGH